MDWVSPVDMYCERLRPGLWAEPVKALTTLSFLLAAGFAAGTANRRGSGPMGGGCVAMAVVSPLRFRCR
jgi:hypothetical protein